MKMLHVLGRWIAVDRSQISRSRQRMEKSGAGLAAMAVMAAMAEYKGRDWWTLVDILQAPRYPLKRGRRPQARLGKIVYPW